MQRLAVGASLLVLQFFLPGLAYSQSCNAICAQAYSYANQSRGDAAFIMQFQSMMNACNACRAGGQMSTPQPTPSPQMQDYMREQRAAAERFGKDLRQSKIAEQQKTVPMKQLTDLLGSVGESSRTVKEQPKIPGAIPEGWPGIVAWTKQNSVPMEYVKWNPLSGIERDPYAQPSSAGSMPSHGRNQRTSLPVPKFDPNDVYRMEPPVTNALPASTTTYQSWDFINPRGCTFDSVACR